MLYKVYLRKGGCILKVKSFTKMINEEFIFFAPRSVALSVLIFLISLPFFGFGYEIPLSLLLGNVLTLFNFIALGFTVEHAVVRPIKSAQRLMKLSYVGRLAVMGVFIYLAIVLPCFNVIAVIIPLFYPKVIYTIYGIINRKGGKVI